MSDQTDPKFSDPNRVIGTGAEDAHRAPEGEGNRAPLAQESGGEPQFSVFDGQGNEQVVVVTTGPDGKPVMPTGDTAAEARSKAGDTETDTGVGEAYSPEKTV